MNEQREYRFNNSVLIVKFGDIVDADTDVIVSSDDWSLPMKDGLSGYILEKGGQEIKNDVTKMKEAELGDVVVSTAGKLPHKYIFHCVTVAPDKQFENTSDKTQEEVQADMEEYVIRHSITKCFRLLSAMDLNSIAIPCIGLRRAGFSFEREGRIMSEVISEFLLKTNKVLRVVLYLWDKENFGLMDYVAFFEQFALLVPTQRDRSRTLPLVHKNAGEIIEVPITHQVFISYSHKDQEIVNRICAELDRHKISYWIDRDGIRHGESFKEDIVKAIAGAEILLFISSANSNMSRNTVKEVGVAETYDRVILPVKIDDSSYNKSLQYDLCNRHWVQLDDWEDLESFGRELNDNIRFYLNRKDKH